MLQSLESASRPRKLDGVPRGVTLQPGKSGSNGPHGWRWTAYWRDAGKSIYRRFPIFTHGWEMAFWMAVTARREAVPGAPFPQRCPAMPDYVARHIKAITPSHMGGVRLVPVKSGGVTHAWSWYAVGGHGQVTFSILKYGYQQAHHLACLSRRAGVPSDLPDPPCPPMRDAVRDWLAQCALPDCAQTSAETPAESPAVTLQPADEPNRPQACRADIRMARPPHLLTLPGWQRGAGDATDALPVFEETCDDSALRSESAEESVCRDLFNAEVRAMLKATKMSGRERRVLELRFGFAANDQDYTLEAIGSMFDLTRERIRQIERDALRLFRNELIGRGIGKNDVC